MMLLQTENNRDRVSAKAILELNQSYNNLGTEQLSKDNSARGDKAEHVPCPPPQLRPPGWPAWGTARPTQELSMSRSPLLTYHPLLALVASFPPLIDASPHPSAKLALTAAAE